MSVNISVSGKTLKECHDQIRMLAREIEGGNGEDVLEEVRPVSIQQVVASMPAPNVMQFPIKPEVASVSGVGSAGVQTSSGNSVDSRGLPWDARIHSSNREQGKDGVWRRRRGVAPEIEAQVEAELRGQAPAPAKTVPPFGSMAPQQYQQAVTQAPAPMPTTEHRVQLPTGPDVLSAAVIPAPAAPSFAPPGQAPVMPPNTHTYESFRSNLIVILNDLAAAGKIDHPWINNQKVQFGGKDVTQWHEDQAACNGLFDAFVSWGLLNKI